MEKFIYKIYNKKKLFKDKMIIYYIMAIKKIRIIINNC
jgi:hypothetical protein